MNKKSGSGSGLFLMEMLMVVFFFILCASTCILVFVKSNNLSQRAQDTNRSILMAQSMIETWKAEREDGVALRMQAKKQGKDALVCYFNQDWDPADEMTASYQADLKLVSVENSMHCLEVRISDSKGNELYTLQGYQYQRP